MRDADCCCEPVLSMHEAFEHAQTRAREMVRDVEHSTFRQLGFGYRMSETPPRDATSAPSLGQHTDELLANLGISDEERSRLRQAGVI
jgi:crotonobetainyl-CoA:carnitine CoA-transferase CaiB-like acyl-CoA transferase